jgi:hypothetical protein
MTSPASDRSKAELEQSQLSTRDIRLLLVICVELINLCAKLTGKIDPAAAAMLTYVRDDIQSESVSELPYPFLHTGSEYTDNPFTAPKN